MPLSDILDKIRPYVGYTTPVFVYIEDARLGSLYYLFVLFTFVTIVISDIFYHNRYMQMEVPVGAVRATFRLPSENCEPLDNECMLRLGTTSDLSYCMNTNQTDDKEAATRLPCVFLDPTDALEDYGSHLLLGTYIETIHQERTCSVGYAVGDEVFVKGNSGALELATILDFVTPGVVEVRWSASPTKIERQNVNSLTLANPENCSRIWNTIQGPAKLHPHASSSVASAYGRPSEVFVADVGRYTMMIDHTMTAPGLGISADNRGFRGYVRSNNDVQCRTNPRASAVMAQSDAEMVPATGAPCWIGSMTNFGVENDIFEVNDLLKAAGIDLDEATIVHGERQHSNRREGVLLVVNIIYSNMKPFHIGATDVYYHVEVYAIPATPTVERSFYVKFPDARVVERIHGIKIFINQTGAVGQSSFIRLMMTLAAGMTMLAVSTFVVDMVGMHLLPEKAMFTSLKYPRTQITMDLLDSASEDADTSPQWKNHPTYKRSASSRNNNSPSRTHTGVNMQNGF
mmetsp:Transcript_21408/g.45797  ORF Transcript_21408/g.45797 Transcript_21408/m.45797 type:complete len:515 (-) Transcript_21408:40-1584(-)